MGTHANWAQVFGRNPCLWFMPMMGRSGKPEGSGVTWQLRNASSQEEPGMSEEIVRTHCYKYRLKLAKINLSKEAKLSEMQLPVSATYLREHMQIQKIAICCRIQ